VDESGTASFDEVSQPVLGLVGIIVRDDVIPEFQVAAERLLAERGLPRETEIHAKDFLTATSAGPLSSLSPDERFIFLRDFIVLGMKHAAGVHHLGMLKTLVSIDVRNRLKAQGLNAYGIVVAYFVVTLDRACILVTLPARYKYFYDRTDAYRKDIGRIFRTLEGTENEKLKLICFKGPPVEVESHENRFIQLEDVAGYFLGRYRQFESSKFKRRPELDKHEH
jgi:hypothetical protein